MSTPDTVSRQTRGPIAWMSHNRVTPNLLMLVLLFGGLFTSWTIKEEVFPDFTLDQVDITVEYSGASPEEVEQGIVLAVEEAIRGIDGIEEITATATEGGASVSAELSTEAEAMRVYQEIQQEVDAVTTLPKDAKEPQVSLASRQREVLGVAVSGPVDDWTLREVAETFRDCLLLQPDITQLEMRGARDYEIQVEVDRDTLRRYDLTLADVATTIDSSSVELPGGSLETRGGEILLRVKQRRDWAAEFAQIPVVATGNGGYLTLDKIATITDGFEDDDSSQKFNGNPSLVLQIYRVGEQTPAQVAAATRAVIADITPELPPGVALAIDHDMSEVYQQRRHLLLKNAFLGLVLVLVLNIAENVSEIRLTLTDEGIRPLEAGEVTRRWRAATGSLPEVDSLRFGSDLGGPGRGAALTVELSHNDIDLLDSASAALAQKLAELPLVTDIKDGFSPGKEQLDFTILPEGRSLGLTAEDVARQVRNAFYGAEALRQQRGRNEIKVMVRLPSHNVSANTISSNFR